VYNRGVDKRSIFLNPEDTKRFLQSMVVFNTIEPIGSIYECIWNTKLGRRKPAKKLVEIICYCLNPNHFHLILRQLKGGGVSEFMKRIGGYTYYFNRKHQRSGYLFQGVFKSTHVTTNEHLLHLSAYVNLNHLVHRLGGSTSKSSFDEYIGKVNDSICSKKIILRQFKNKTEYKEFIESSLENILERKDRYQEMEKLLLE